MLDVCEFLVFCFFFSYFLYGGYFRFRSRLFDRRRFVEYLYRNRLTVSVWVLFCFVVFLIRRENFALFV